MQPEGTIGGPGADIYCSNVASLRTHWLWCAVASGYMLQIATGSLATVVQCLRTPSSAGEIRTGPTFTWGEHSIKVICFLPRLYPAKAVPTSATAARSTG